MKLAADSAVADEEWLPLAVHAARFYFRGHRGMSMSIEDREDACSAALTEGLRAAEAWDGRGTIGAYVWVAMQRGIIDWIRLELGRKGHKVPVRFALSLTTPVDGAPAGTTLADLLVDRHWEEPFDALDDSDLLARLISSTPLTSIEREWVENLRAGKTASALAARTGVSDAAVSQAGRRALRKLKAAARCR